MNFTITTLYNWILNHTSSMMGWKKKRKCLTIIEQGRHKFPFKYHSHNKLKLCLNKRFITLVEPRRVIG